MQRKCLLLSLSFASTVYGTYCCPPGISDHFLIETNWMYVRRSDVPERTLAVNTSILEANGDFEHVLKSENLTHQWQWQTGLCGKLTYVSCEEASLEAIYFYVFPWTGRSVTGGNASLAFPFDDPDFTNDYNTASFVAAKYNSNLQNGEFNYWGHLTPRRINYFSASWILGFRFMYLRERLNLAYTQSTDLSNYRIKTKNLLYGAQGGFVFEINPGPRWTWTVIMKGATFLNDARDDVFLGDENNTLIIRDFEKKRWAAAWLLEGVGSLTYQWYEHMNIHIGYQGILATGFALAPKQLEKGSSTHRQIEARSNMVLDGFFAGLTFSF
ncbi:MAG TPA: hypothetical protein VLG76_03310 [Rhabdochlamydiaceae bacterium]|nr:hypothetical protein [Rhabdochlamydiaceae bacterium]